MNKQGRLISGKVVGGIEWPKTPQLDGTAGTLRQDGRFRMVRRKRLKTKAGAMNKMRLAIGSAGLASVEHS